MLEKEIKDKKIHGKHQIATLSVIASGSLSAIKFIVGLMTGSLGLMAEGMHSLLDLLTSVLTLIAVKIAAKPPDANHPYGHERAESLGALAGMVVLGTTACVILYHALRKIFFEPATPEVTPWSFLVIIISVIVDFLRARSLRKAARHYQSQALASDAEHFSNDMLGSIAVLLGLLFIFLSHYIFLPEWLITRIDAIAALGVVVIAFQSVWSVGLVAIQSLMDDVPEEIEPRLKKLVENIPGVVAGTVTIRTRFIGNKPYVEVLLGVTRALTFEKSHELTKLIENAIVSEFGGEAQVIVYAKPTPINNEPYGVTVRAVADRLGLHIHNLNLYRVEDDVRIELDLELSDELTLQEAQIQSELLEQSLIAEFERTIKIFIHLEPRDDVVRQATRDQKFTKHVQELLAFHEKFKGIVLADLLLTKDGWIVEAGMSFKGQMSLAEAHVKMYDFEHSLRVMVPEIIRVHVYTIADSRGNSSGASELKR